MAGGLFALVSVAVAGQLQITHPAAGDTPPAGGTPPADLYVAISKYKAANDGVNFGASQTTQHGQVTAWRWNFANGTPSTSSQQNPGVVKFSAAASYGNRNACTVNLAHTSTDENGQNQLCTPLTGLPVATININVVKPKLVFNVSAFSQDDDAANINAQSVLQSSSPPVIGSPFYYASQIVAGATAIGGPYEYIFTIDQPSNSGAVAADTAIVENSTAFFTYYSGDVQTSQDTEYDTHYYTQGHYYTTSPHVQAPANPTVYFFDAPGYADVGQLNSFLLNNTMGVDKIVQTTILSSYALFQDSTGEHIDYSAHSTKTVVLTAVIVQGTRQNRRRVSWSVSYE